MRLDTARALLRVHTHTQLLAGLEVRNKLSRNLDLVARLRIPAYAWLSEIELEAAESTDLDALPLNQTMGHRIEDDLDRDFRILGNELRETRSKARYEVGAGHE